MRKGIGMLGQTIRTFGRISMVLAKLNLCAIGDILTVWMGSIGRTTVIRLNMNFIRPLQQHN